MIRHALRRTLMMPLSALTAFALLSLPAASAEKDVTQFIHTRTAVPQTVDREWKANCTEFFCGALDKKGARVVRVSMDKKSEINIRVKGTVVAVADFGPLSPLHNRQTIFITGDANPVACTFKLEKLRFADGFAQFLVDVFAGLEGKVYPFRDRRGKCDQYFPKDL